MSGRSHASHNEQVCDFLHTKGTFNDWVITTAFYSAIHYIEHQLFPMKIGTDTFPNFSNYYNKKGGTISKHKIRRELVAQHLTACSGAYNWLQDNCFNARYNDYQVHKNYAVLAKEKLQVVKATCPKG